LDLEGKGAYRTPLQNFFYHTKSGHCEFFATATVLILRYVGIPARYATGFIAHEYSGMEDQLVVRRRDAHAWVKVYLDGQWEPFDTTPASFLRLDADVIESSRIADLFSFFRFKISQFRHETGALVMEKYGLWLILPLVFVLFLRLRTTKDIKKVTLEKGKKQGEKDLKKTLFGLIEDRFIREGHPKFPHETYLSWIKRVERYPKFKGIIRELYTLLRVHNRMRFDKTELSTAETTQFESDVRDVCRKIDRILSRSQSGDKMKSVM
jgi:hypothetical protein